MFKRAKTQPALDAYILQGLQYAEEWFGKRQTALRTKSPAGEYALLHETKEELVEVFRVANNLRESALYSRIKDRCRVVTGIALCTSVVSALAVTVTIGMAIAFNVGSTPLLNTLFVGGLYGLAVGLPVTLGLPYAQKLLFKTIPKAHPQLEKRQKQYEDALLEQVTQLETHQASRILQHRQELEHFHPALKLRLEALFNQNTYLQRDISAYRQGITEPLKVEGRVVLRKKDKVI